MTLEGFARRPGDMVARIGGEEFGIVLGDTNAEPAAALAERVRKAIRELRIAHKAGLPDKIVTVSGGVATALSQMDLSEANLLEEADQSLYLSKKGGRDRITATTRA